MAFRVHRSKGRTRVHVEALLGGSVVFEDEINPKRDSDRSRLFARVRERANAADLPDDLELERLLRLAIAAVPCAPAEPPSTDTRAITFDAPEPWPDAANGAELLDAIETTIGSYLFLDDEQRHAVALWALSTHVYDVLGGPFPRLLATSPMKRCGKTRLLSIMERLVPRPLATPNLSAASFYRLVDETRCTLLCDEMDQSLFVIGGELVGLINAGFQPGQGAIRCSGEDFQPRAFNVYAPMVLAGISTHRIPDTIRDRSIVVNMRRKPSGVSVKRLRERNVAEDFEALHAKAIRWALDNRSALETADPDIPSVGNDRAADCWEVMLAVADCAGGSWPTRARNAMRALCNVETDPTLEEDLLGDLRLIIDERLSLADDEHVFGSVLVPELTSLEGRPWNECYRGGSITQHWLARRLSRFALGTRTVRVGHATAKGYAVGELRRVLATYLAH